MPNADADADHDADPDPDADADPDADPDPDPTPTPMPTRRALGVPYGIGYPRHTQASVSGSVCPMTPASSCPAPMPYTNR